MMPAATGTGQSATAQVFNVIHRTRYAYGDPVAMSQHLLHLTPRISPWQLCLDSRTEVHPKADESSTGTDFFGNPTQIVALNHPHAEFVVEACSTVQLLPRPTMEKLAGSPAWEEVAARLRANDASAPLEARQFLFESPCVPLLEALQHYASPSFPPGRPLIEAAFDLTRGLHRDFRFDATATDLSTPLHEVLRLRRGVCQDFAHVMIGCLRTLGLAARYMSGYIQTRRSGSAQAMVGADASHAWVSVWCPQHGWVDFDPTNNCLVDREHITVAFGRDFSDVTPVRGVVLGSGDHDPEVEVTVQAVGG